MHRALRTLAAALVASSATLVALAQSQPQELPKGIFPPEVPAQNAPAGPAQRVPDERAPPSEPATLPDGRLAVPPLARLTDSAGVLSASARAQLEAKLAAFERAKGSQIAVIVVPSTQPEPISDFTNRVGDAWKIGRKGVGDGVLITVAVKDRRVWISVARALEGAIPDVVATRITRELMGPFFAKGDFAGGLNAGVDAVMKRIEGEALPAPTPPKNKVDAGEGLLTALIPLVIFGTLVGALLRRIFGVPGALVSGAGTGTLAGFLMSSVVVGTVVGIAVLLLTGIGRGGGGRMLGGRRHGGPLILPGGWGGGGWSGGGGSSGGGGFGGGGFSSGGGGDFAGGGGGSSW
jgi:uncharacterized protein